MAGEGGNRPYWPTVQNVNLSNGNLQFSLGAGSCVTCGSGAGGAVYANPRSTTVDGPILVYNTLGTGNTDLGPKWMLPYHTYLDEEGSDVILIDADGTQRVFTEASFASPQPYTSAKEDCTLVKNGSDYILTRRNGDQWIYDTTTLKLDTIISRTGHTITIARDGNQRITSVTDGQGRVTSYLYQTFGGETRLVEIREPAPGEKGWQSTFLGYETSERLCLITNTMGDPTRFEYDGSDRINKAIDGHGHATNYTYDGSSRITNVEDADGNDTTIAYASGPPITTTVTDRLTHDWVYTFDSSGRVIKTKDPEDNEREWTYDASTWEITVMLGPRIPKSGTPWTRHRINFIWDIGAAAHDLLKLELKKVTNSDSTGTLLSDEEWTYTTEHDILTYQDQLGKTTSYTYKADDGASGLGLLYRIQNPETDYVLTNVWEQDSGKWRLASSTNGVSKTTEYDYNDHSNTSYGAPNKITLPSGAIILLNVDIRGRKTSEMFDTDPIVNQTLFQYDALDRMIRMVNPDGTSTENLYDCCHLVATLDENQVGVKYDFDVMGNLTSVIDANGETTSYVYNDEGWMTSMTDPRGKTTSYSYDYIGRRLQVDYPGGWQEIMTYFEPGMLKTLRTKKSSDEDTITFSYDDSYFLIKKDFSSGTDTEFEVDAKGRRTKMKDASGEKRYTWDDADRLEKVIQGPIGFVENTDHYFKIEYVWNRASQCTQKKVTIRTLSALQWDYVYTDDGYIDTVTNPDSEVTNHDYLVDGRLKKITLRSTGTNKTTRELFYQDTDSSHAFVASKNKHLRKTLDKKEGGTVICSSEYDLDPAGMRLGRTLSDGKYDAWSYDPNYQLRTESRWSAKTPGTQTYRKEFDYDGNGNRTAEYADGVKTATTVGDNNQLTAVGEFDIMTDFMGNTIDISDGVTDEFFEYNWERNLMTAYLDESQSDTHEYDGDGRRMRSRLNSASNWTHFVHDELTEQVLGEFTLVSTTFTLKAANTYGWGLISSNRETVKRYFHFDGLGNTLCLTDSSETTQDSYAYTAFGTPLSSSGSSVNPYRYVGEWGYYDDGAMGSPHDFVLCGVRYYAPRFGRFLTWDPIGTRGYGYCDNSATMVVDPTGLFTKAECKAACQDLKRNQIRDCELICRDLRGSNCGALRALCNHMDRHGGGAICWALGKILCPEWHGSPQFEFSPALEELFEPVPKPAPTPRPRPRPVPQPEVAPSFMQQMIELLRNLVV